MQTSKRIGLLVPSSNTTVETEFRRILPQDVSLHCARLFIDQVNLANIGRMTNTMEQEAKLLATADVDIVVLGATAPSFLLGPEHDKTVSRQLREATGRQATTTSTAMLAALHLFKAEKIAVGSAFSPAVNDVCVGFLRGNGFDVVSTHGLNVVDNMEIGRLPAETAYEVALRIDRSEERRVGKECVRTFRSRGVPF